MHSDLTNRRFWKMSGSGNDFVFFDATSEPAGELSSAAAIGRLCDRRRGVGADGVVLLERHERFAFLMRYFNRDGSLAEMCGNAALCSTRLATVLGIVPEQGDFTFDTVSGPVTARLVDGLPEIDMVPVTELASDSAIPLGPHELRLGYSRVGVPHLVALVEDVGQIDVLERGRQLRHWPTLRDGANANFVSKSGPSAWAIRTFERGVEDETLACGTGAVAAAALLTTWGKIQGDVSLTTRSGRVLRVSNATPAPGEARPSLRGEGRIVFSGILAEI